MPLLCRCPQLRRFAPAISLVLAGWLAVAAEDPKPPAGVIRTLKGHTEAVYAITFSPDGKHVLSGSFDKTLKLWETASGKEIKTYGGPAGHQNLVLSVAISPDGRSLASGASDNTAKLWEAPGGGASREFAHVDALQAIALSPDGSRLAGAVNQGAVRVWNSADGTPLFNLTGHRGAVTSIAISADGKLLACAGIDQMIRFWNLANGELNSSVGAHAAPVHAIALHPNGSTAYSAGADGTLKFWQLPPPAARALPAHSDEVTAVALSTDGSQVLTASADKTLRLTSFATGQQVRQLTGPTAAVSAAALSPNGAVVAGGTRDHYLYLWDATDGRLLSQWVAHAAPVTGVAFHPGSGHVLSAGGDGLLKLWTLPPAPAQILGAWEAHAGGVTAVAFHANGVQALSGGADKTVKLWDLATRKVVRTYGPLAEPVTAVALSRDGTEVAAAAGSVAKIWTTMKGKEILTLTHPAPVLTLAFNHDKTRLVTGAADGHTRVWVTVSGQLVQFFQQGGPIRSVAFHNNNSAVVAGSADKTVAIQPLSLSRLLPVSGIRSLALTPNGSHLLVGSDDKSLKLWNTSTGEPERTFAGAEGAVSAVAISRNGVLVASGGADKMIRVYTLADAKQIGLVKTTGTIRRLAFGPNNQWLAAASDDQAVKTWNVVYTPGQPVPADFGKAGPEYAHAPGTTEVVFSADSGTLYSAGLDKMVRAWRSGADTGPPKSLAHANLVDAVAFSPSGAQLATGSHDGIVRIWDIAKGQPIRQINAHTMPAVNPVYCVAWSSDGKQILSSSLDRSVKLWDATAGTLIREFKGYKEKESEKGHRDGVFTVALSPDGKLVASGSSDRTIKIWTLADGTVLHECVNPQVKPAPGAGPQAHPGWVYSLRFTPDGTRLVSVGNAPRNQGYLALWQVADGKLLSGEELPLGPIYSVAVAPDGKLLAIGCGPRGRDVPEVNSYLLRMPEP